MTPPTADTAGLSAASPSAQRARGFDRRRFLIAGTLALGGCIASGVRKTGGFDAFVSSDRSAGDRFGVRTFATVADAIAAAPSESEHAFRIRIARGRWREKLVVDKPNIHLIGEQREACVLTFDAAARDRSSDGEVWGTWGSASVIVRAPGFRAADLTIENAFDYVGELRRLERDLIGPNGLQAVALMLDAGSDRALVERCDIRGHQDTLFADAGRSLFRDCRIAGSVDFVFGGGNAWFERCELHSRYRPARDRQGMIAVPSTSAEHAFGLTFHRCRLTRDTEIPAASVVLGRAWRPTRTFSDGRYGDTSLLGAAVYLDCWMDAHIAPEGWDPMAYTTRDGTRTLLHPQDARLFEYASSGPGAHATPARRELTRAQAAGYTFDRAFGGWKP